MCLEKAIHTCLEETVIGEDQFGCLVSTAAIIHAGHQSVTLSILVNFLIIECLERYYFYYGDDLQVEYPTGSGNRMNLLQVSLDLCRRVSSLFLPDEKGRRPCHGDDPRYHSDPNFKDLVLFYEFFHGDTGRGCGAR